MTEKRIVTRLITVILLLVTVASVILPASADANATDDGFAETLRAAGFPDTYIPDLLVLHKKHPEWTFEAIDITALSRAAGNEVYTWDYVIKQESDANEKRNLVTKADDQFILRNFTNPNLYDSGWYQASKSAVEYMMDPRNFLTEEQVFQFFDLRYSETATLDAVKAVCAGTFMQDAGLDDIYADMTYAEYFMQIGKELGANPVYLATVVRNEQGVKGTSPLISGLCGDKLWYYYNGKYTDKDENGKLIKAPASGHSEDGLKAYNGLYNYFNISASGTGYFSIYLGGMKAAAKGTPDMSAQWGGSPAWNTRWKALFGGASSATKKYINDWQNTFYFQKFNVDPRSSRNFWGQYMQSLHGSTGRASQFFKSYKANGLLDVAHHFAIPVYEGMPAEKCRYPDGTELCDRRALESAAVASYDILDMNEYLGQDGMKRSYSAAKISWRNYLGSENSTLALGAFDLTKYDYALIDYSTDKSFDSVACGKRSVIGFVSSADAPYGGSGTDENFTCDLGHAAMGDAKGGYEIRRVAKIDLRDCAYNGDVFLTAYTQPGKKYMVHNIVFYTLADHTDPLPPETAADTVADDTEEELRCGMPLGLRIALIAIPSALILAAAGAAAFFIVKKRKNKNTASGTAEAPAGLPSETRDEAPAEEAPATESAEKTADAAATTPVEK